MNMILTSKRIQIAALIVGVVIVLWYQFLFREQREHIASIEQEITETETLVRTWIEETKNLSEYQNKYVSLEKKQQKIISELPSVQQVDQLSQYLINLGKNYNCNVTYFGIPFAEFFSGQNAIESTSGNEIFVMPLQLVVEGDFASLGSFIDALAELPYFTAFGELEIRRQSDYRERLEMDLSMMIFLKRNDTDDGA